jgi:UDP-glucose:(heptosyl)LPS alpha-1,3-glucosyltransferase
MKIGLAIESFDASRGGAEQWTSQYAHWLARAGHEVHVVAAHFGSAVGSGEAAFPGRLSQSADGLGSPPHSPPPSTGVVPHLIERPQTRIDFALATERAFEALDLDVTHDMGSGWHCQVFQPHGGSRTAAFEQNLHLLPRWLRPLKRHAAHCLPRYREFRRLTMGQYMAEDRIFIALSQMVARDFERFHGVRRSQIRIVYNGVDTERFSPDHRSHYRQVVRDELGVSDDETLLLIVAHNFRLKGVPVLAAAVERLRGEGWPVKLAVVGGKRPFQASRGDDRSIIYVGPAADTAPYYAAADLYVQPTFYDPCSLVVLEAWASGLPVVTSRFNGAGELMTPGVEGAMVADPSSVDELCSALRPLFDRDVRAGMSAAARRLALANSLERNGRNLLAVYEEVVASRRRAAA